MPSAYSPVVLEHFRRPRHRGALEAPTVTAEAANPLCGDRVRVQLRVEGDRVSAARFTAEACAVAVASASLLMGRVEGATLSEVAAIDDASVVARLESELPEGRRRCATLVLEAVRRAIAEPRAGTAS